MGGSRKGMTAKVVVTLMVPAYKERLVRNLPETRFKWVGRLVRDFFYNVDVKRVYRGSGKTAA